jgi:hypothetical protein
MNVNLEALVSDVEAGELLSTVDALLSKSAELSRIEVALQESFRKCINGFKTA